ncbi:hypothetical protein ABBQ32_000815 [Trebouxia sp. C0010 RCD-2024]
MCIKGLRAPNLKSLKHPRQITTYIKQQREQALSLLKTPLRPEAASATFGASMDALLSTSASRMNSINFSAVMTASAQVWAAAQLSHTERGHAGVQKRPEALYRRCVQSLQPLLADMSAWAISSMFWSSVTLRLDPDAAVPGMGKDLAVKFVQLTDADKEDQRPNALSCVTVLEALTSMGHSGVTAQVAEAVCRCMCSLLQSTDQEARPTAKECANVLSALRELKHAPSHDVASAMLDHLVALCRSPGLEPTAPDMTSCLFACAELGLSASSNSTEALLKRLLEMPVARVDDQDYYHAAWSLAVMGRLDFNTFAAFLSKLTGKRKLLAQKAATVAAQPTKADATQLYQALEWLRPSQGSQQMEAWSSLRSRLQTLAPQPPPMKPFIPGQAMLKAALAMHGMPLNAGTPYGMYYPDAVLLPHDSSLAEVLLVLDHSGDHVMNVPSR